MEEMKKPVYVDVNEVCADWGVCRSKGYAIIKGLIGTNEKRKSEVACNEWKNQPYLLRRSMYEEVTDDEV